MRRIVVWGVGALAAASFAAGLTVAAPVNTVSVGQLSVRLARSLGARLSPSDPEASAAAFLNRHGLPVGEDLSRPVLGRDLIAYGRAVGASVATSDPGAPATTAQAVAFVGAVRGSVFGTQSNGNGHGSTTEDGINASCRGREARDGRNGEPASNANPNATAPPCDGEGEPTP